MSSDRDEASFADYYAEMPWAALPFGDRDRKAALSSRFKVRGIPTLVLLDGAGGVITTDGRSAVGKSGAAGFPWAPKTIGEALGSEPVVDAAGASTAVPSASRYVALYFSASWCPPCRGFTPKLVAAYNAVNAGEKALDVLFVSGDRDEASFKEYHSHMPWHAVPYDDEARRDALNTAAGVRGIPTLVLCERDAAAPGGLRVVNASARGAVEAGRAFPAGWLPPAVADVNDDEGAVDALNEGPVLCLLAEGAPEADTAAALAALTALKAAQAQAPSPLFVCAAYGKGGMSGQLRKLCALGEPTGVPQLALVDCPKDEFWLLEHAPDAKAAAPVCDGDVCTMPARAAPGGVDEAAVRAFVDAWRAGTLTKRAMGAASIDDDDDE